MIKLRTLFLLAVGLLLLFPGCSKKNSDEACQHEVTMNLDSGNFEAVLASGCANAMQRGAAYFGKAGFDVTNVINRFSETGSNVSSSSTGTSSDLTVYMRNLLGNVDANTLASIDNSVKEYSKISATDETYRDAKFYISLVDMIKSLSLIKMIIPNLVNPDGTLTSCDLNNNKVPDAADATACALTAVGIMSGATPTASCSGASYSPLTPVPISLKDASGTPVDGTYSGLIISITTSTAAPVSACTTTYYRLLYKDSATGKYWAATTTSDICTGSDGKQWPCPLTGANLDFVTAVDTSIFSSVSALSAALTTTTTSDVQTALNDIRSGACSSPCVCPGAATCPDSCLAGSAIYCSSADIAHYIQTNLK